ncbi:MULTISPECIES: glycoside hydrolase family 35 protein [unclassified Microbacterium]|uniref:glycoside hydrolase family 35 protein n=1 Tax=unclassified Microbacterium TaxID=2609290 RepID=UPI0037464A12
MSSFEIGEHDFLLDDRPHRILSGALHYFRVHPDHWADRIRKARLMGLNTIETYVAWNAHEPRRGEWLTDGANDLGRFLDLVAAEGMHAIVRPGPYICAEWHNGGLPVWLTALPGIGLRRSDPTYLAEVGAYLRRVYDIVVPRQIDRGGPVILVQIENEYGAYGRDKDYLRALVDLTRETGVTVPLTTIDQPTAQMLEDGSLPGLHLTGSFGSRATERLATLREHQPSGPLMCAEFWDGWFDWWGGHHHTTSPADSAAELEALLAAGASVNFYMFHGGTNFGLTNGANDKGRYLPITTSYDYDAPLDETGAPTAKYQAFRDVIARYAPVPEEQPGARPSAPEINAPLDIVTGVEWSDPADAVVRRTAPTFEELGHLGALVRYDTELPADLTGAQLLQFDEVRDHARVSVDGTAVGSIERTARQRELVIPAGRTLSLLVEEQGRVNYDVRIGEHKGLIGTPLLGGRTLEGWTATPIHLDALDRAVRDADEATLVDGPVAGPALLRARFGLQHPADLFLDTTGWGRGFAFVNGFLLGRYAANGPQRTLFVPEPVTRPGENVVVVVELQHVAGPMARFAASPDLGPREE